MKIIGSFVSPYVRKVLACLELKGLGYQVDPITPFYGNDEFERLSPLRRIPVLIDGDVTLCDSTVICAYLEEAYPATPLRSITVAISCGCAPFTSNEMIGPLFRALPIMRTELISPSRSCA